MHNYEIQSSKFLCHFSTPKCQYRLWYKLLGTMLSKTLGFLSNQSFPLQLSSVCLSDSIDSFSSCHLLHYYLMEQAAISKSMHHIIPRIQLGSEVTSNHLSSSISSLCPIPRAPLPYCKLLQSNARWKPRSWPPCRPCSRASIHAVNS